MAPGPSKTLFGVTPQDLVGLPLTAFINVFSDWKEKVRVAPIRRPQGDAGSLRRPCHPVQLGIRLLAACLPVVPPGPVTDFCRHKLP